MSHPAMLAKIHIAKKDLGLAEAEYRALLQRVGKVTSARDLSDNAADAVIAEMKRLGWQPKASTRPPAERADVRKIYALWKALHGAGRIASPSSESLRAWVQRQFKVSAPEFLKPATARSVIEQLKRWIDRPDNTSEAP
ncbi:gp16 family protein [Bosea sp. 2KB_26]|uniref:gp16 family protein n=1 Tax=Bosea sp. 2KB_26 TaxID=3237475 RepID=UPI003F8F45D0